MRVVNIRGVEVDALVGPEHGASRIFIWCVTVQAGQVIGMSEFLGIIKSDGVETVEENFVQGSPWSRTPDNPTQYITHEQLLARYREVEARNPIG